MKLHPVLAAILELSGVEPLIDLPNRAVISGDGSDGDPGFAFEGTYTDNSTTVVDLTLGAANVDAQLIQAFGSGDNPEYILYVDSVKIEIMGAAETEQLLANLGSSLFLRHIGGQKELRAPLHGSIGTYSHAVATTANAETRVKRAARWTKLPSPFMVNMNTDSLDLVPRAAVNMAADVPFKLYLRGCAWQSDALGFPEIAPVKNAGDGVRARARGFARRNAGRIVGARFFDDARGGR